MKMYELTPADPGNMLMFSHAHAFAWIAAGIPIAIQIIRACHAIYQDPTCLKKFFGKVKNIVVDSMTRRSGEHPTEFKKRLCVNALVLGLYAGLLVAAVIAPLILFPSPFGPILMIVSLFAVLMSIDKRSQVADKVKGVHTWSKTAFVKKINETDELAKERITKNVLKVGAAILGVIAVVMLGVYIFHFSSAVTSIWSLDSLLPLQTPLIVMIEYLAIAAIHIGIAIKKYREGRTGAAIFHTLTSLIGIVCPFVYLFDPRFQMRLHHSFLGLLFALLPTMSMKALGTMISVDSALYFIWPFRHFRYDFINVLLDFLPWIFLAYGIGILIETLVTRIKKSGNQSRLNYQHLQEEENRRKKEVELKKVS